MFGKSFKLFTLFGFEVKIDLSWLILAALIVWTLATGLFPYYFRNFSTATYWYMGIAGAVGLFLSIVFHEMSHSLVARNFGIPMRGITLFIFGGVAEMNEEPPSAKSELFMALAGPIASVVIGGVFYGIATLDNTWSKPIHAVLVYLGFINLILAGFNMLPAFPLDGGRVLRSILWAWKKNLRQATYISSRIGEGFGILLILLGVVSFFGGNFIGGVWWVLIGWFLRNASRMSYRQLVLQKALEGESVRRFMRQNPVTVASSMTLERLVDVYVYRYHFKFYPVVDDGRLVGCIKLNQIKEVPREEWTNRTVADLAGQCSKDNTIQPDTDATRALALMRRSGNSRLMVAEGNTLVGIISLKDLLEFLSTKIDLGDDSHGR